MRSAFMDTIMGSCKERQDVFIISGDAGLGVFDKFRETFPERFLNLGVAEQNTISFAAGLSLTRHKVYVYNIIPFVLYRCYEQVRNDICYQRLPVTLVGIGSGVTYAPQGMTHYAIEDIGLAKTLPNLRVFSPVDPIEADLAARYSLAADGPVYVRLAKRGEPALHTKKDFNITHPQVLKEGKDAAIVCHGSVGIEAMHAASSLQKKGITVRVISVPQVQPFEADILFDLISGVSVVMVVEEHYLNSGLCQSITCEHAVKQPSWKLLCRGIPYAFVHEVKDAASMRKYFGIDAESIARDVQQTLKDRKI